MNGSRVNQKELRITHLEREMYYARRARFVFHLIEADGFDRKYTAQFKVSHASSLMMSDLYDAFNESLEQSCNGPTNETLSEVPNYGWSGNSVDSNVMQSL